MQRNWIWAEPTGSLKNDHPHRIGGPAARLEADTGRDRVGRMREECTKGLLFQLLFNHH